MNTPTVAPFLDGRAMRQAVKTAAASSSGEMSITERMQQIWFDRFLCRVFSDAAAECRVLPIEDHLAEKAVSMLAHEHGGENAPTDPVSRQRKVASSNA